MEPELPSPPGSLPRKPTASAGATPSTPRSAQTIGLEGKNLWMKKNVGQEVASIGFASLQLSGSEQAVSSTQDSELICSYNWSDSRQPTILVPGGAPVYKTPNLPVAVIPDEGRIFVDQNAYRAPEYPFQVMFQATEIMNPALKFDDIDIITNRNSLRHLLDFCQGRKTDSFRVNLFLVGTNTLLIERCVKSPVQWLNKAQGGIGEGLGHAFEKAITELQPDLQGSSSHHRVLRYHLGGVQCAVRFEVDACVNPSMNSSSTLAEEGPQPNAPQASDETVASLIGGLKAIKVSTGAKERQKSGWKRRQGRNTQQCATVLPRGLGMQQKSAGEIKSATKKLKARSACIPQMWLGRTPWLIRGSHEKGTYTNIEAADLSSELKQWEARPDIQGALRKMALLLSRLRDTVKAAETKSCVLIHVKGKPSLHVFLSTSARKPLPDDVVERFWQGAT